MSLIEILITMIAFVLSLVIGIYFAGIPLRMSQMTKMQNIIQQVLSVVCIVLAIVLFMLNMKIATLCVIFALCFGMFVGKIPPIHSWLLSQFPYMFLSNNDPRRKN